MDLQLLKKRHDSCYVFLCIWNTTYMEVWFLCVTQMLSELKHSFTSLIWTWGKKAKLEVDDLRTKLIHFYVIHNLHFEKHLLLLSDPI